MTGPRSPSRWGPAPSCPMVGLCRGLLASPGPEEELGGPETHPDQAWLVTARSGQLCRLQRTESPCPHVLGSQPASALF